MCNPIITPECVLFMRYLHLKNDFVQRAVFLNARNANKLWRVFKEQTKERSFIFKA